MSNFTHCHVHTAYSFLDGMCKLDELIARAKELGMTALAITDHNHLGGTYDFQKKCKEAGIKPLLGYEAYYTEDTDTLSLSSEDRNKLAADYALDIKQISQEEYDVFINGVKNSKIKKSDIKDKVKPYMYDTKQYHIIFIAMNQTGWKNIVKLQSESATKCTFNGRFLCDNKIIAKYSEGVICTTACVANRIARYINQKNFKAAEDLLVTWKDIFKDRFYLEIQPLAMKEQIRVNAFYLAMSAKYNIPLVATNDVHYVNKEDHDDHDTLLCIGTGKKKTDTDRLTYTNDFWLRSYDEMVEAFHNQYNYDRDNEQLLNHAYLLHCQQALAETNKLADRVDADIKIGSSIPLIPQVKLPKNTTPEKTLRNRCFKALYKLAQKDKYVLDNLAVYEKRLAYELSVINPKGFASYLLVVDEYVSWANNNGCVTGPGRGSAAGSLALYLLGVTKNTDPIKYHMLFERFLTKDRTALPDIDTDFDFFHRDDVIHHLEDYYGKECVAHIGTYTIMGVKSGLKDVGRVLNIPFDTMNNISKQLDEIMDTPQPKFKDYDNLKSDECTGDLQRWETFNKLEQANKELFRLARKFEGLRRNFGVHASGILAMPLPVTDMMPTRIADGVTICLYTGPEVEELNCVKCDLLGLKTVSVIVKTLSSINMSIQDLYDTVKVDDPSVFQMLCNKKSDAVFQLESDLFKGALELIQPTDINDIVAITAALRPGPLSIQSHIHYAKRKNGEEEITYPLRGTEHIFKDTYGLALYQEQLNKILAA